MIFPPTVLILAGALQSASTPAQVVQLAREAIEHISDTASARDAGFVALDFGDLEDLSPFQGQHWIHPWRLRNAGDHFGGPSFIMFVPMHGVLRIVGIAYSRQIGHDEEVPQTLGDVHAPWHLHQMCFGIPGEGTLLADGVADCRERGGRPTPMQTSMVHVWTDAPSPGGPFAHDNPALPYLAVGLEPPTGADVASPDRRTEVRALALALGESYGARMPYARRLEFINEDESLARAVAAHRAVIAKLVPQLVSAEQQGNRAAFDRLAGEAVAEWHLLRAVYESMAPTPEMLTQLKREHGMALGTETHHPHGH